MINNILEICILNYIIIVVQNEFIKINMHKKFKWKYVEKYDNECSSYCKNNINRFCEYQRID